MPFAVVLAFTRLVSHYGNGTTIQWCAKWGHSSRCWIKVHGSVCAEHKMTVTYHNRHLSATLAKEYIVPNDTSDIHY